jgi:two-component system response regulator MprA
MTMKTCQTDYDVEPLEQVWGDDFEGESNAAKVYVAYLRQKLSAAGEPDLIHAVRGVGYVLRKQGGVS